MTGHPSLVRGLVLRLAVIFAVGPFVAILVLLMSVDRDFAPAINPGLEHSADILAASLQKSATGHLQIPDLAALGNLDARVAFYGNPATELPLLVWPKGARIANWEYDDAYMTVRRTPFGIFRLVIFSGRNGTRSMVHWLAEEIGTEILPVLLILTLISLPLVVFTVRRHFAPLRQLIAEASAITADLGRARLSESNVPLELLPLVQTVNASLDRIETGLTVQKRFAATIAHELRTPISVLIAMLERKPPTPDRREALTQLKKLSRLINQILTISELSAAPLNLSTLIDLKAAIRETVSEEVPRAIPVGITLELEAPDGPFLIRGNAAAIKTAVRNLIDNAVKHSPAGGLVSVRLLANPAAIEVADEGGGIADAQKEQIFEPFWRHHASRGAGVGLAIVRDVAGLHGARVFVTDNTPKGSVFRIEFPYAEEFASRVAKAPERAEAVDA